MGKDGEEVGVGDKVWVCGVCAVRELVSCVCLSLHKTMECFGFGGDALRAGARRQAEVLHAPFDEQYPC